MRKYAVGMVVAGLLGLAQGAGAAELVTNGGFETGDFTGWTQFDNTGFTGVTGNFSGIDPHSGDFQAFFGPVGSTGGIEQTLTVAANTAYTIDFWLHLFDGTPNSYEVTFDGVSLTGVVADSGAFPYTHFTLAGTTDGDTSAVLRFSFQHNPSYFLLDDVSVVEGAQVAEPATLALLGLGLAGLGVARRRKSA